MKKLLAWGDAAGISRERGNSIQAFVAGCGHCISGPKCLPVDFLEALYEDEGSEMMRTSLVSIALAFSLQLAMAQDFRKSYVLPPGGQILIGNVLGDVRVEGYKGSSIEIVAVKKGPDRDLVEIRDRSFGDRIDVHSVFPKFDMGKTSVEIAVRVPDSVAYNFNRISSFNGNVEISNVIGRLRAESVRGNVVLKGVSGLVSASSHSGNVRVEIHEAQGRNNMRFSSISGDVDVQAPAGLDALIDMSSISGLLKTDFPIEIQERRYGPGRSARGRLGSGKQIIFMTSVSGIVSLHQNQN